MGSLPIGCPDRVFGLSWMQLELGYVRCFEVHIGGLTCLPPSVLHGVEWLLGGGELLIPTFLFILFFFNQNDYLNFYL